jgi:AcrR family transcriptional regulator
MTTKELILETALRLFNDKGTNAVSTNHIAAALGISPGNLYYHYRNKEEIIRAIFERLYDVWDTTLTLSGDHPPTLDDLERLVRDNFMIMWDYRFVYRELAALLHRDAELRLRYESVRQRGFADFQQLFTEFVTAGILVPLDDPQIVTNLAEVCWLISEFWLSSVEISGERVTAQQMQHGVELMMQVMEAYIVPTG